MTIRTNTPNLLDNPPSDLSEGVTTLRTQTAELTAQPELLPTRPRSSAALQRGAGIAAQPARDAEVQPRARARRRVADRLRDLRDERQRLGLLAQAARRGGAGGGVARDDVRGEAQRRGADRPRPHLVGAGVAPGARDAGAALAGRDHTADHQQPAQPKPRPLPQHGTTVHEAPRGRLRVEVICLRHGARYSDVQRRRTRRPRAPAASRARWNFQCGDDPRRGLFPCLFLRTTDLPQVVNRARDGQCGIGRFLTASPRHAGVPRAAGHARCRRARVADAVRPTVQIGDASTLRRRSGARSARRDPRLREISVGSCGAIATRIAVHAANSTCRVIHHCTYGNWSSHLVRSASCAVRCSVIAHPVVRPSLASRSPRRREAHRVSRGQAMTRAGATARHEPRSRVRVDRHGVVAG